MRNVLNAWDPIGVAGEGPPDEYDCLIEPLRGLLGRGAAEAEISEFLRNELREHFLLDPALRDVDGMASRLVGWWAVVAQPGGGDR